MELTGEFYPVYASKELTSVHNQLMTIIKDIGYQCEFYITDNAVYSYFAYRDQEMYDYHLETGYNTDIDESGCFSIDMSTVNLNGKADLFEFEGQQNIVPLTTSFFLSGALYLFIVLPNEIGSCLFSQMVMDRIVSVLSPGSFQLD